MRSSKPKFYLKVFLIIALIVLPITLVWTITISQDRHFDAQAKIKKYQEIAESDQKLSENKIIELLNFVFLAKKFDLYENKKKYPNLNKISRALETIRPRIVSDFILEKNFWNQEFDFGKLIIPHFFFFSSNTNIENVLKTAKIGILASTSANFYNFFEEVFLDDVKRKIFRKIRDWSDLVNENNKQNLAQLRGLIKNQETSKEIENIFQQIDKLLENPQVFAIFSNPQNKTRIEKINLDVIFEIWTLWKAVLQPFYTKIATLNNAKAKAEFIRDHLTESLESSQKTELNAEVALANPDLTKIFNKLHQWNARNLLIASSEKLKQIPDLLQADWINVLIDFVNPVNFKKVRNLLATLLIEYWFDYIEQKTVNLEAKTSLTQVVTDMIDFFKNGLFSNGQKWQALLKGIAEGLEEATKILGTKNSRWKTLQGTFSKLLETDLGRATIFSLLNKSVVEKLAVYIPKITEWEQLLKLAKVVFGKFEIRKLAPIFETPAIKAALKAKLQAVQTQFIKVANQAKDVKSNTYKSELIEMVVKSNDLLKFLISDTILKPTPTIELDSNFWLFFTIIVLYLEQRTPSWKKISEIAKIIAQHFKNADVLQIATKVLDLFDDFAKIVNTFVDWKSKQGVVKSSEVTEKIFNLLGIYEEQLTDATFIGKAFNVLLAIKKKYEAQIIAVSKSGEDYFTNRVQKFFTLIDPNNWEVTKTLVNDLSDRLIYEVKASSRIKIVDNTYKYAATYEILKDEGNLIIREINEGEGS